MCRTGASNAQHAIATTPPPEPCAVAANIYWRTVREGGDKYSRPSATNKSRGNRYILTVVNHFIKHAEAYALPDQEAPTVARAFLNEFVSRYRVPYVIYTDQQTNFELNLFKEICKLLGIAKTRTSPYHPQCDGQIKRMNRTLVELLSLNVPNPTENWDLDLGLTLLAYRNAVQSSNGLMPYFLLYVQKMRLLLDIIYLPPSPVFSRTQYAQEIRRV